jgi:hypothetical protein
LEEDLIVQVQIVTVDFAWNCKEFCNMGTYASKGDAREVSPLVAKDCKGLQRKSSKLLNPSVFKYILEFRAASGLALALNFFFNVSS